MRYLVHVGTGAIPLRRCVASYGGKLALLLRLLPCLPYRLLSFVHLGFFAEVALRPSVASMLGEGERWNVLVGTYNEKQKLVVQCFASSTSDCRFIKIGNEATEVQMTAEMHFLQQAGKQRYRRMLVPQLTEAVYRSQGAPFNIQVTREFHGRKVPPVLTEDIYELYRDIAGEPFLKEGQPYEFSHGDFTPWNLRRCGDTFVVFDWEHCGTKPHGYDLVYFETVVGLACRGKGFEAAFTEAVESVRRFEPDFDMDRDLFYRLFTEVITPEGF